MSSERGPRNYEKTPYRFCRIVRGSNRYDLSYRTSCEADMTWFTLSGDSRLRRCASDGCGGQPTARLEVEGLGSDYCSGCKARILSGQYTITPARYAKGKLIIQCPADGSGWKTRAMNLAEAVGGKWVHRSGGYTVSKRQAERFEILFHGGADASPITGEIRI